MQIKYYMACVYLQCKKCKSYSLPTTSNSGLLDEFTKSVYTAYIYDIRSEQRHMHQLQIINDQKIECVTTVLNLCATVVCPV